MDLRHLRYFQAVAEELSYSRAAERLRIAQPALSRAVQEIEAELGGPVLDRNRRRVILTPAGRVLLRETAIILERWEEAMRRVKRTAAGEEGELRLGYIGPPTQPFLGRLLAEYRQRFPLVAVHLEERTPERVWEMLAKGRLSAAFTRPVSQPPASGLRMLLLRKERFGAVVPAAHPLAALKRVPLSRLAAEPLVLFPRTQAPGLHDRLLASLTGPGGPPVVAQYAPETQTIVGLVAAEIGVSLVQASVQRLALPGVTYRPVVGAPTIELAALLRPGEESRPARDFVNLARAGTVSPSA